MNWSKNGQVAVWSAAGSEQVGDLPKLPEAGEKTRGCLQFAS